MTKQTKVTLGRILYAEVTAEGVDLPKGFKSARLWFIHRAVSEIGMTPKGASTYFSNLKNEAAGKGLYYAKAEKPAPAELLPPSMLQPNRPNSDKMNWSYTLDSFKESWAEATQRMIQLINSEGGVFYLWEDDKDTNLMFHGVNGTKLNLVVEERIKSITICTPENAEFVFDEFDSNEDNKAETVTFQAGMEGLIPADVTI